MALALAACSSVETGADGTDSASTLTPSGTGGTGTLPGDDATVTQGDTGVSESNSNTEEHDPITGTGPAGLTEMSEGSTSIDPDGTTTFPDPPDTDTTVASAESSTGPGESTGDTGDTGTTADESSTTGPPCVPVAETCNDLDDDCDDIIDDVDAGGDGICDCLSIALVGNPGSNNSSQFQTWLQAQGTTVTRINASAQADIDVVLDPAKLAAYDIVILDYLQRTYSPQEAADMATWIEGGGGLMSLSGHVGSQFLLDRENSLLADIGLQYNGSAGFFSGPVTQFAAHPITMGLTSLTFAGGVYVDIIDDGVGVNTVIMTLPPGPVGVVQERLQGAAFVFGDEWVEFDSEWQSMPEIPQFWAQTLAYLSPKDFCAVPQ